MRYGKQRHVVSLTDVYGTFGKECMWSIRSVCIIRGVGYMGKCMSET